MKPGVKLLLGLLAIVGVGWLFYSLGWFGNPAELSEKSYALVSENQGVLTIALFGCVVVVLFLMTNKQGQTLLRVRLPEPNALNYPQAFESLGQVDEEYHDFLSAALTDYYYPPKIYPVDLANKGVYYGVYDAITSDLPRGMSTKEVISLTAGLMPNPFMEKSRLLSRADYNSVWIGNKAKRWGEVKLQQIGNADENIALFNQVLEKNPEAISSINLLPETERFVKTESRR